jgi:HD-GYP domain-containing protein (c-di-GMP phosphodiesterase class II)
LGQNIKSPSENFSSAPRKKVISQEKELKILRELNQIMREGFSFEEVMASIAKVLADNVRVKALIMSMDRTGLKFRVAASSGLHYSGLNNICLNINEGIVGKTISDGVILFVNQVKKDPRVCCLELLAAEGINCLFSIPLYNREKVIGALVFMAEREEDLKKEGLDFLTNVANHISVALEKAILYENIYENYLYTIKALVAAIDAKDNYTRGHSERVMEYAVIIAKALNLPDSVIDDIKFAALLHDIGKIGVDEKILRKPGRLTEEEFSTISAHPQIGAKILSQVDYLRILIPAILYHHERFSGDGYPQGIAGTDIPLAARILAVADSLDAMTYDRPYRRAFSIEQALNELVRCSGTQFDPQVVAALLKSVGKEIPEEFQLKGPNKQ